MGQSTKLLLATALGLAVLSACGQKSAPVETTAAAPAAGGPARTLNTGDPVDGDATLSAPASVGAGSPFAADWTGPANSGDYIDIVQRGETATTGEISYVYIRDALDRASLRAPTEPGDYDLRYVAELADGRVVKATTPLTVTPAKVTFDLPPTTSEAGAQVAIAWTGPANDGDYIDIVPQGFTATSGEISYAYTSGGSPSRLTAPGVPGDYEIRYVAEGPGGRQVIEASPLTVTAVTAELEAAAEARRNAMVSVTWTGPAREGDYIDLVPKGFAETSGEVSYFYTRAGSPGELKAADKAGDYEIRYIMEAPGGRQVLARIPLKVK